eukprot:JP446080.1.p1 GENE.JP446080.1~~JP446080.1.p1  ORF type:complete len:558 (+),score=100.03 JP446080.1:33-1706(+)
MMLKIFALVALAVAVVSIPLSDDLVEDLELGSNAPALPYVGSKTILTVVCELKDYKAYSSGTSAKKAAMEQFYTPVTKFYNRMSYGQFSHFIPSTMPGILSIPYNHNAVPGGLLKWLSDKIKTHYPAESNYDHVMFWVPGPGGSSGWADIRGKYAYVQNCLERSTCYDLLGHELGHNLGLHDNRLNNGVKNEFDSMGGGDALENGDDADFVVSSKVGLGWIPSSKFSSVHPQGPNGCPNCVSGGTFFIAPFDKPTLSATDVTFGVRIYLDTPSPKHLWLSVRSFYPNWVHNKVIMDLCPVTDDSIPYAELIDVSPNDGDVTNAALPMWQAYTYTEGSVSVIIRPLRAAHSDSVEVQVAYVTTGGTANLALYKTATQKDTRSAGGAASRAVDGNTNGLFSAGSVTHTQTAGTHLWWEVSLGATYTISSIKVYNRLNYAGRLAHFKIQLFKPVYHTFFHGEGTWSSTISGQTKSLYTFTLPAGKIGNTVKIYQKSNNVLSLAEVQVFGSPENVQESAEETEEDLEDETEEDMSTGSSSLLPDLEDETEEDMSTEMGVAL